jgi:hypothetical protein
MKLLVDENLSRRLVPFLQHDYLDSAQVVLLGLESASDIVVWQTNGFLNEADRFGKYSWGTAELFLPPRPPRDTAPAGHDLLRGLTLV